MLANFAGQFFRTLDISTQHDMRHRIRKSTFVGCADDRCFGNVGMTEERVLHFRRRNPHAGNFQHVIGAPAVMVITV